MSTTLVYNDVIFRDCETKLFDQTVEYDESHTDLLLSRFRIRVASTLVAVSNTAVTSFGITTPVGATAAQRAKDIHARLSEPRKDFWFLVDAGVSNEQLNGGLSVDGNLLIAAGNPDGTMLIHPLSSQFTSSDTVTRDSVVDVDNGPKPGKINITEIIGGRSFRVEFEIEICRKICVPGYTDSQPDYSLFGNTQSTESKVLSNRWSLDESKDENWITTRVLQGTLRVTHKSFWPHLLRTVCVPPLLRGYKRVRQSFVDDPTGLVLKYRIEDQQAHASPPWPAIGWKAHHAESASGPNGSILTGEISVRLTGPPGVDKVQLIGAAGKIAVDRIKGLVPEFVDGERDYKTQIINASVVNVLHEPTIELRVQAKYTTDDQKRALAIRIQGMGQPLTTLTGTGGTDPYLVEGYDPRVWPVPLAYDSKEPAGLFACYLQHPCSVWHSMPAGTLPGVIEEPERKEVESSGYPDAEIYSSSHDLPEDTTFLNPPVAGPSDKKIDIYNYPYFFVDLENEYQIDTGWSQLPYANTDPAAKSALLVRLHKPVAQRVLTMIATRDGQMPLIPSLAEEKTDHNGIREVLSQVSITPKAPEIMADGSGRRYSVRVQLVYLLERAPTALEKLRGGSTQLDKSAPLKHILDLNESQDTTNTLQF